MTSDRRHVTIRSTSRLSHETEWKVQVVGVYAYTIDRSQINDTHMRLRKAAGEGGWPKRRRSRSLGHWGEGVFVRPRYGWPIGARACACTHLEGVLPTPQFARHPAIPPRITQGIIFHFDRSRPRANAIRSGGRFSPRASPFGFRSRLRSLWSARGRRIDGAIIITSGASRREDALRRRRDARKWRGCDLINRRSLSPVEISPVITLDEITSLWICAIIMNMRRGEERGIWILGHVWIIQVIYIYSTPK